METMLDNLVKHLLEQMQKDTALTNDEKERLQNEIEGKLILEGYLNE